MGWFIGLVAALAFGLMVMDIITRALAYIVAIGLLIGGAVLYFKAKNPASRRG